MEKGRKAWKKLSVPSLRQGGEGGGNDNFYTRKQQEGEAFDEFLTEIIILSKNCNFCAGDCHSSMITDRIVGGVKDEELKKWKILKMHSY